MTKSRNILVSILIGLFLSQIFVPSVTILSGADSQANSHTAFASNENETIIYYHADHLSGSHIITDENGNVIEATDYLPFGEIRTDEKLANYENDYKYTGKELDDSGLYYYGARYYDPAIGKFLSADPWGGDIHNPQSLNKYSYVMNNPLRYTDPSGKSAEEIMVFMATMAAIDGPFPIGDTIGLAIGAGIYISDLIDNVSQPVASSSSNFGTTDITKYYSNLYYAQSDGAGESANAGSDLGNAGQTVGPGGIKPEDPFDKDDVPKSVKDQIPESWGEGTPADKGKGWKWNGPNDPSYNEIRFNRGEPNSLNPGQRADYVSVRINGHYLDESGNIVPRQSQESHIPVSRFRYPPPRPR